MIRKARDSQQAHEIVRHPVVDGTFSRYCAALVPLKAVASSLKSTMRRSGSSVCKPFSPCPRRSDQAFKYLFLAAYCPSQYRMPPFSLNAASFCARATSLTAKSARQNGPFSARRQYGGRGNARRHLHVDKRLSNHPSGFAGRPITGSVV